MPTEEGADPDDDRAPIIFRAPHACAHDAWEVARDVPSVTCRDCGETLDPYWCLRVFADNVEKQHFRLKDLAAAEERLRVATEREGARYKARLERRARRRAGITGVIEGGAGECDGIGR